MSQEESHDIDGETTDTVIKALEATVLTTTATTATDSTEGGDDITKESEQGNDGKCGMSPSVCGRVGRSLKCLEFYMQRSKILNAHEECVRLQDLLAFSSYEDHKADECPLGDACPVLPGEHRESIQDISAKLAKRAAEINNVMNQCHSFSHSAEKEGEGHDDDDNDGWILGADMFGIKTYYKTDEEDGQISLRMEAEQDVPVFEQMV
jgi:hypothetical protein